MSKRPLPPDRPAPDLTRERALWQAGIPFVAGIDEAGRGALAGPVIAAAVIVPAGADFAGVWRAVRDSKLLRAGVRTTLAAEIRQCAAAWSVGAGFAEEIDRLGVAAATRLAMRRAVEGLACAPGHLLVDWVKLPQINLPQTCWAKADQQSVSVAAASILAKVHRDDLMIELDAVYPAYGFARHKGYGAPRHLAALAASGPCPAHRRSFAPLAQRPTLFDSAAAATKAQDKSLTSSGGAE